MSGLILPRNGLLMGAAAPSGGNSLMPVFSGYTNGSITVSASREFSASYRAWEAFDGSTSNQDSWVSTPGSQWLKIDFGSAQNVSKYDIWHIGNVTDIKTWTFQGSDNNSSWTTLDSRTVTNPSNGWGEYTLASTETYRYYRLNITANNGNGALQRVDEMKIYD